MHPQIAFVTNGLGHAIVVADAGIIGSSQNAEGCGQPPQRSAISQTFGGKLFKREFVTHQNLADRRRLAFVALRIHVRNEEIHWLCDDQTVEE